MTLEDELDHKDQWKKLSQKELDDVDHRGPNRNNPDIRGAKGLPRKFEEEEED